MFKVFKKKTKHATTPTFGSSGKSKSLFSLNKNGEKRKSSSSDAFDKKSPVQTLSLQYQHDSDLDFRLQSSHSNQNHDFRSFLGDEVIDNGYEDNWNRLTHDRSKSVDALDTIGRTDPPSEFRNGYSPGAARSKARHTWQSPDSPRGSSSRGHTASLFLEQLHVENQAQTPATRFSTFKSPAPTTTSTDSGYRSPEFNGEHVNKVVHIPVPHGFDAPTTGQHQNFPSLPPELDTMPVRTSQYDTSVVPRLPPELDTMSVRSSQYEASVIMPPSGFNDTLNESILQRINPTQSWAIQSDTDSISIISTDSYQSDQSAHVGLRTDNDLWGQPNRVPKSVSQECVRSIPAETPNKLRPQSSYPALPPKPSVKVNVDKYKPKNRSHGTNQDVSNSSREISNGTNTHSNVHIPQLPSPALSTDSNSTVNSESLSKLTSGDDKVEPLGSPASNKEVSLKPNPTPPPRRIRLGSKKRPPLVTVTSTTSESSVSSLQLASTEPNNINDRQAAEPVCENINDPQIASAEPYHDSNVQNVVISKVNSLCQGDQTNGVELNMTVSNVLQHDSNSLDVCDKNDRSIESDQNENIESKLSVMPGPMIMSLREHMKRSPPKQQESLSVVICTDPIPGDMYSVDKTYIDNVSTKPPIGESNVVKSSVSGSTESKGSSAMMKEERLDDPECDLDVTLRENTGRMDALETSSRLSNTGDIEMCSLSSINESQHIMISDSFLDDTALSSYEPSEVDSDDSEVDFNVMVKFNEDFSQETRENTLINKHMGNYGNDSSGLDVTLNGSSNLLLSDSFLNDTVTPLLNCSVPGATPLTDTAIIVEDDYTPDYSLSPASRRDMNQDNPSNQPWEVSMAMSWGRNNQNIPNSEMALGSGTYLDSADSSDSESTVAASERDNSELTEPPDVFTQPPDVFTQPPDVYRWQPKPVLLWDVEDVCQWLGIKDLGSLEPIIRDNDLSGLHLLQMPLLDLGELTSNNTLRQKFTHSVQDLRDPQGSDQLASIKKISMRRKDLEVSNEVLAKKLHNLSWLNEQEKTTIGNYLKQLEDEQTEAKVLLSDDPSEAYTKLPIMKWSNYDVLSWLDSVGMEKFSPAFKAHNIIGQDLMSVDMELLDSLGMSSIQDRELILSRLYELQHPETNAGNVARLKELFSQPPSLDSDKNSDMSKSSSRSASRKVFTEEEKLAEENVSERNLKIWHDITGAPACTTLAATSQMTSLDVIIKVLRDSNIQTDHNLFTLTRVTMNSNTGKVYTTHLKDADCPEMIHKNVTNSDTKARLELRSKTTRKVKVQYDLDSEISNNKALDVSSMCTCGELLNMAISAFSLYDTETYEIQSLENGVSQSVGATKLLLMYDCDQFRLAEKQEAVDIITKTSHDQLEGANHTKSQYRSPIKEEMIAEIRPPDTMRSPMVEEYDWASLTGTEIQLDPDLTTITDSLEQLSTLSDDLECLSNVTLTYTGLDMERHYSHEQPNVFKFHSEGLNLSQYQTEVTELREGLQEKDKIIQRLQLENEEAHRERKKTQELRSLFASMEMDMKQRQADLETQYTQQEQELAMVRGKGMGAPSGEEGEVDILQQALMVTGQQIQLVEQREVLLQAQLGIARANIRSDPSIMEQLKHQLSETDAGLLDLKQQQADIYRQLKMARKQLLKMQKSSIDADRFTAFKLLQELGHNPSVLQQVIAISHDPSNDRCDYILGHDHTNRPIIKHAEDNSHLKKGDRILEINGLSVTHINETDLAKQLKYGNHSSHGNLSVVVMRKVVNYELRVQEKMEEVESIREDLSLTIMELDTAQADNQQLQDDIQKLEANHRIMTSRNSELESHVEDVDLQLQQYKQEVQAQMADFKQQLHEKDKQIQELHSAPAKATLQALRRTASNLSRRSDNGVKTKAADEIRSTSGKHVETLPHRAEDTEGYGDLVLSYEDYGQDPIWESLQQAPKNEILQALKDQVLENEQQKVYLDHLLTAVIDHAPNLVQIVDQCLGVQDHNALDLKIRSEEFC